MTRLEQRLNREIASLRNCEVRMLNPKLYEGMYFMRLHLINAISELNRVLYGRCSECNQRHKGKAVDGICRECREDMVDEWMIENGKK